MSELEDRLAIHELIALHGHLVDEGGLDRLDEIFSVDVVYDLEEYGFGRLIGIAAVRDAALALGERNPVGHHVTNVVIEVLEPDRAVVRSKGFGVTTAGVVGSVVYEDVVIRGELGWRISYRRVVPRRTPLAG